MSPKHKRMPLILGILFLAACLGLGIYQIYQSRFAPVGENRYEKTIDAINLSGQSIGDLTQLQAFPDLKEMDLRGTGLTCEEYDQLKEWFPGAKILWDVPFQGGFVPADVRELTLTSLSETDLAVLAYFTELKTIRADDCPDYLVLDTLRRQRPDLELSYRIPVAGDTYRYQSIRLSLPGESVEELFDLIPLFPELWSVELKEPLAPVERILALQEAFPEIIFSWHLELGGVPVNQFTETLDLTGIPMTVEEMDAVLPYLLNLTYVDMTDCGISDEEMDALNKRYENIKIVWTVTLGGGFRIRTDVTSFIPVKHNYWPCADQLDNLRYCTDIIAIDVGHMQIDNCDFVANMPHLKYLILAETRVHDLTPLTGLTELVYLELFIMQIDDYSPLLTLTALEDLNVSYSKGDPEIIAQMTWLKNVWWYDVDYRQLTFDQRKALQEAIPECNFNFTSVSSTGGGWRELPNYYAQRDALGMYYMHG